MSSIATICEDPVVANLWHPLGALAEKAQGVEYHTMLLGESLTYVVSEDGAPLVVRGGDGRVLPTRCDFGYLWTSLGEPPDKLFEIPEFDEPDRRSLNACSIMVATSAPRAVENFLDMGHFPYVHTNYLGVEPHTEVVEYDVDITDGEIWATECKFYQPRASASAGGGQMTDYTYRVPHPYCAILYKTVPTDPSRRDVIAIFLQPMTQEKVMAHNFLCMVDEVSDDTGLKWFQQVIFSQDKPILENQNPKRLPLDPRAETPIRADKSAIVYRRLLRDLGMTYSVIPAAT